MHVDANHLLTANEVAALLKLRKTESVRSLIKTGRLAASNISQGKRAVFRVSREAVEAFLESAAVAAVAPPPARRAQT